LFSQFLVPFSWKLGHLIEIKAKCAYFKVNKPAMLRQYTQLISNLLMVLVLPLTCLSGQDIVGGADVEEGKYPFMVGLIEAQETNLVKAIECGATVIGERWVMTAGHCIASYKPEELEILVGTYNLENPVVGYRRVKVEKIFLHPNYARILYTTPGGQQGSVPDMDIALIRLSEPVKKPVVNLPG
jgi:secreted trypsin-like serine protease